MSGNAAFQSKDNELPLEKGKSIAKDEYKSPKCVMFGSWQVMLIVVR